MIFRYGPANQACHKNRPSDKAKKTRHKNRPCGQPEGSLGHTLLVRVSRARRTVPLTGLSQKNRPLDSPLTEKNSDAAWDITAFGFGANNFFTPAKFRRFSSILLR